MVLLVSCSFAFQYFSCSVHDEGQRTKEAYNIETCEFHI